MGKLPIFFAMPYPLCTSVFSPSHAVRDVDNFSELGGGGGGGGGSLELDTCIHYMFMLAVLSFILREKALASILCMGGGTLATRYIFHPS